MKYIILNNFISEKICKKLINAANKKTGNDHESKKNKTVIHGSR